MRRSLLLPAALLATLASVHAGPAPQCVDVEGEELAYTQVMYADVPAAINTIHADCVDWVGDVSRLLIDGARVGAFTSVWALRLWGSGGCGALDGILGDGFQCHAFPSAIAITVPSKLVSNTGKKRAHAREKNREW